MKWRSICTRNTFALECDKRKKRGDHWKKYAENPQRGFTRTSEMELTSRLEQVWLECELTTKKWNAGRNMRKSLKRIAKYFWSGVHFCQRARFEKDVRTPSETWIAGGKYHKHSYKDVRKDQGGRFLGRKDDKINLLVVQLFWKDIPSPFRTQLECDKRARRQDHWKEKAPWIWSLFTVE